MSGCTTLAAPAAARAAKTSGVPRIRRKCEGAKENAPGNDAPGNDAPCAQCQAEAAHGAFQGSAASTAPLPAGPPRAGRFEVGAADDAYEREADRIAQQVMDSKPATPVAKGTAEPKLRRLPTSTPNMAHAPADVQQVIGGPGMPLDPRTRSFFEPRFGRDFSSVRVHADDVADRSARALDAQAYTVGHHVVFSRGKYSPGAEAGRRLLAHELAHVVQQSHPAGGMPALQRKKGKGKGPGSCGLLSAATATILGGAAHLQIQSRLSSRGIRPELEVPRATKSNGISRACAKLGTVPGFADVARVTTPIISLGEIKPYYIAKSVGKLEARHYRRRAEQSKQRLTGTGTCGKRSGPGPDDIGFQLRIGPVSLATTFMLLTGVISGKENFGAFSQDPLVDLIAQEVGGGGIGYWCRQNAAGKKAEEEEKKKKKQKKPKGKGGAANLGIGVSIGGANVGGGNVGAGVSIDSNSAAVGTAGAGIAISSDSAAAGAAGVGASKDSMGAAAGAAGAGTTKDSESVAAGAAGVGSTSGSTSAGAGVAGSGKSEDSVTAAAGTAGKGEVKDSVTAGAGGSGSGKMEGAMGAGKAGSSNKPIDPQDVSGKDAEKTPEGGAEAGKGEGSKGEGDAGGAGDKDKGDNSGAAGGDKEGSGGDKGAGKGGKGSSDKAEGGKGGGGTGGDKTGGDKGDNSGTGTGGTGKDGGTGTGDAAKPGAGSGKGAGAASNPLGVYTVIPLGTSDAERERIAAEAAKVTVLVHKASEAQKDLLRHLSGTSPDKRYMVPTSQWVEKMMNVTKGLSVEDIQYLKQLNWTPGHISEAELRQRIEKLLANKPKTPPKGQGGSMKAPDQPGGGGGKGGGKGTGEGDTGQGKGKPGGSQAADDKTKKPAAKEPAEATDRVTDPPKGAKRDVAGNFMFWILSGITADSDLKEGTSVACKIRVHDLKTERTFELEGVSITFLKRTLTPVTLEGVNFNLVKTKLHITKDIWSDKYKFYGRGGPDETIEYDFGRRRAKK